MDEKHVCNTGTSVTALEKHAPAIAHPLDTVHLLTRSEAAAFLRLSETTIDRLRYERKLSYYKIGGAVRFGQWDLEEFISGKPVFLETVIPNAHQVLKKVELATFLGLSIRTVEHLILNQGLWHRKTGRLVRFLLSDVLMQLVNNFRVAAQFKVTGNTGV